MRLTRLELEIMDFLWTLEEASVRQIQETIPEAKRPAYTTVQTIIQRLEQKGAVRRSRKIGNALMFVPTISRTVISKRLIEELLEFFDGSAQPLIAHLVEAGKLQLEDIRELERALELQEPAARKRKGGAR